tara:strand:- start:1395 stop:1922 length:528 start_codon:yes stop_codon:yes gene_type:complete
MWSFSQNNKNFYQHAEKFLCICVLALVSVACSGVNIHQLGRDNQSKLQEIGVIDINTREGQLYGRELRKLLHIGGKSSEKYELKSTINATSSSTLSVQGAASSLKKMSMTASFQLSDVKTGETLFTHVVVGDATLGASTSFYGQDRSEAHARERLAILLAQRVVRRLQLYFLYQS